MCDKLFCLLTLVRQRSAYPNDVTHPYTNTCFLKSWHSSGVRVSAFAIRGMTLTLSWSLFMNSMSSGFRLKGRQKENHKNYKFHQNHQQINGSLFIFYIKSLFLWTNNSLTRMNLKKMPQWASSVHSFPNGMQFRGSPAGGQTKHVHVAQEEDTMRPVECDWLFVLCALLLWWQLMLLSCWADDRLSL